MDQRVERIYKAAEYVRNIIDKSGLKPRIGIVLGSGLGKLADKISNPVTIPYRDIPGFYSNRAQGQLYHRLIGRKDRNCNAGQNSLL